MNAYTRSDSREEKEYEQNYSQNDGENVRVVRFPKEVKIYGNITRVQIEGNEKHEKVIFDRSQPTGSQEHYQKKTKNYIIIPIKGKDSEIQFVKAPIYKLGRKPKGKKLGEAKCWKLDPYGEDITSEELPQWSAERKEFLCSSSTDAQTAFIFLNSENSGRHSRAQPLGMRPSWKEGQESKKYVERGESPIVLNNSMECVWKKSKETTYVDRGESPMVLSDSRELSEPPTSKKRKSTAQSDDKNSSRLLKYMITLKGRNKKGRKF